MLSGGHNLAPALLDTWLSALQAGKGGRSGLGSWQVCTQPVERCPLHTKSSRVSGQRWHQNEASGLLSSLHRVSAGLATEPLTSARGIPGPHRGAYWRAPLSRDVVPSRRISAGCGLSLHAARLRQRIERGPWNEVWILCSVGELPSMGPGSELPVTTPLRSVAPGLSLVEKGRRQAEVMTRPLWIRVLLASLALGLATRMVGVVMLLHLGWDHFSLGTVDMWTR